MSRDKVAGGATSSMTGTRWWKWLADIPLLHWVVVAGLTALAIWVRVRYLEGPMRYDEAFTVWRYAKNSLVTVLADYSLPNNHIFHTLLVHWGIQIGGIHPDVVRMPALAAGILMVPVGFIVIGRIAGLTAGLFMAAFIAGSSLLIDYSVNARGYTMAAGLSLLALGLVAEIRRGTPAGWSTPLLVLTGIVAALGLWTVPVFAYPLAAVLILLAVPSPSRDARRRTLDTITVGVVALGVALLFYTPVILNEGAGALTDNRFVTPEPLGVFVERFPGFLGKAASLWIHNVPAVLVVLLVVGFLIALWSPGSAEVRWFGWSVVIGILGVHFLVHATPPPRAWVVVLPVTLGVSAAGLGLITYRRPVEGPMNRVFAGVAAIAISVVMVAGVVQAEGSLSGEDDGLVHAENIAFDLQPVVTEADYVAADIPSTAPLRYYFELHGLPVQALRPPEQLPEEIFVVTARDQTAPGVLDAVGVLSSDIEAELISSYDSGNLWRVRLAPKPGDE